VPPGKPAQREQEASRHGVRARLASCVVATGQLVWHLGQTRTRTDWAAHLAPGVQQLPAMQRYDGVVDTLHTPWSLAGCRLVAHWGDVPSCPKALPRGVPRRAFLREPLPPQGFPCTPQHGAGLHHVERWLSVLARRFLNRGDLASVHDCATRLGDCMEIAHTHHAQPYR
jgi:hypothetical protein